MLFISTEVSFASDCLVPSFSSAHEATDAAKTNTRGTANCKTRFMMTSVSDSRRAGHSSESFHVFDQRLLILVTEISPKGMSARSPGAAQVNVYLTPPGETGLLPHYDTHDVMVLQANGSKNCQIFGRPVDAPTRGQPYERG